MALKRVQTMGADGARFGMTGEIDVKEIARMSFEAVKRYEAMMEHELSRALRDGVAVALGDLVQSGFRFSPGLVDLLADEIMCAVRDRAIKVHSAPGSGMNVPLSVLKVAREASLQDARIVYDGAFWQCVSAGEYCMEAEPFAVDRRSSFDFRRIPTEEELRLLEHEAEESLGLVEEALKEAGALGLLDAPMPSEDVGVEVMRRQAESEG